MGVATGVQLFLSAALLLLGVALLRRSPRSAPWTAAVLLGVLLALALFAAHFIADWFTAEGINAAAIYHLRYGLAGAGLAEYAPLAVAATAGVAAGVALLAWLVRRRDAAAMRFGNAAALACVGVSIALHPAAGALARMAPGPALARPAPDVAAEAEFRKRYRAPSARPAGGPPRNLVLVYAESLERAYFDEQRFPGLIRELRELEAGAVSFTDIDQASGTGWTIAGMVASQCGIPLFTPSDGNAMSGMDTYLPAATCLGDLLRREGYHLVYYGGAPMRFAGKGKFYAAHGFHEIAGRSELAPKLADPSYVNAWGLYDDSLLELAFDKYAELARAEKRFALVLLTLDTHPPEGHLSQKCRSAPYAGGANPILNAVHCTDRLLGEFVARIRNSPWGKDTVVAVASDHLAMRNTAYEKLQAQPRRNLLMVIDPRESAGRHVDTPGSTLDIGPTLMRFLGYQANIGLGRDLLGPDAREAADIRGRLQAWSEPLAAFWGFPRLERQLEVDEAGQVVRIDERAFPLPLVIELDAGLQTVLRFPGDGHSALDLVRQGDGGRSFVALASCAARDARLPERLCLFAGRGREFHAQFIIDGKVRFTAEEIRGMTGARS